MVKSRWKIVGGCGVGGRDDVIACLVLIVGVMMTSLSAGGECDDDVTFTIVGGMVVTSLLGVVAVVQLVVMSRVRWVGES
ncbi:hypothetical protein E2C01_004189 [Portunus trituberculatus]|uniref:Transmembrane protein n=1 Tax=Portunus trituberculatus TaxID=210409 RepID=A0A5B7CP94_PORTR|nr:hypothetical protein [Portunus trituberculatus]